MKINIQWDVVWSTLRTLLVAGGPVTTLLIALDFPPVLVSKWSLVGLAVVGVLSVAVPGFKGALNRTDSNKIKDALVLPKEAQARIAAGLPNETKIAATAAIPDVAAVVVKPTATNGTAMIAADPAHPKVVVASNV
jgi:hypothetical protein